MKILSIQPFSLFRNGGGSRVLRRLYKEHEKQIHSIAIQEDFTSINTGNISEEIIYIYPYLHKWMRWKLRNLNTWLQSNLLRSLNIKRIKKFTINTEYDVIHLVSHGDFVSTFDDDLFTLNKSLWISFHDYYSTTGMTFNDTLRLWNKADRRLVISYELGREYQKIFGFQEFELITDGVSEEEISEPNHCETGNITVYFAGLLHIEYLPLFSILSEALDNLQKRGISCTLVLRGTQKIDFLNSTSYKVEYRSNYISDEDIKQELDSASILYLPIKFSDPNFYLYSLSTKMISYLGGSGSILYHGPDNSAAYKLLYKNNSAIYCTSLNVNEMINTLDNFLSCKSKVSHNAKTLARKEYNIKEIRKRFWQL